MKVNLLERFFIGGTKFGHSRSNDSDGPNQMENVSWPDVISFNGIIDEVRIYDRALSRAEIETDMNTPMNGS